MGLVYDAQQNGSSRDDKSPAEIEHSNEVDSSSQVTALNRPVSRTNGISDLFPEMEATCRLQDGVADDEFREPSLFGRVFSFGLAPADREVIANVAYGFILIALFVGAFVGGVRFLAVDWDTPLVLATGPTDSTLLDAQPLKPSKSSNVASVAQPVKSQSNAAAIVFPPINLMADPGAAGRMPSVQEQTKPISPHPLGGAKIQVDGIVRWTGAKPIAIVNGMKVEPGDSVAGYTVMAIDAQGVLLLSGGELYYVPIKESATLPA